MVPQPLGSHTPLGRLRPETSWPWLKLSPVCRALSQLPAPELFVEVLTTSRIVHWPVVVKRRTIWGTDTELVWRTVRTCEELPLPGVWQAGSFSFVPEFVSISSSSGTSAGTSGRVMRPVSTGQVALFVQLFRFWEKVWMNLGMPE